MTNKNYLPIIKENANNFYMHGILALKEMNTSEAIESLKTAYDQYRLYTIMGGNDMQVNARFIITGRILSKLGWKKVDPLTEK